MNLKLPKKTITFLEDVMALKLTMYAEPTGFEPAISGLTGRKFPSCLSLVLFNLNVFSFNLSKIWCESTQNLAKISTINYIRNTKIRQNFIQTG